VHRRVILPPGETTRPQFDLVEGSSSSGGAGCSDGGMTRSGLASAKTGVDGDGSADMIDVRKAQIQDGPSAADSWGSCRAK
jgi:hypothetical protein